jgi:hypothetical protein
MTKSSDTVIPRPVQPNELRPELLSTAGLNPWPGHDSSSRVQMFASSHISQALQIAGCTPRRTLTGVEREFGKFTFKVEMPCNATILKVIEKFPATIGRNSIKSNPLTIVVYEDVETKEVGILQLVRHNCYHQHFGFKYKYKPSAMSKIYVGANIAKGTVIADSPSVTDDGDYCYGVDTQVAFMSVPGVIEDGVIVSRSYIQKLKSKGFESRVASWGKKWYPLNLYGTDEEYRPFPEIGEKIRDDGLLFALRQYDDLLAPVEMTPAALREPDYTFDRLTYAVPGSTVTDITIRHDNRNSPPPTPFGMEGQTERYLHAQSVFYDELVKVYNSLKRDRKEVPRITPEFQRYLFEALMDRPDQGKDKSIRMYQRVELDHWRVEVNFEYDVVPGIGFKLTDCHGGKGVICDVWDDADMPRDMMGNVAEIIMDAISTIKRMNLGRLYEQYINATSWYVSRRVREIMQTETKETIQQAWDYLIGYYRICSPRMYEMLTGPSYLSTQRYHVERVVAAGVYLYIPTDNPADSTEIIRQLLQFYPVPIGPIQYRGRSGNMRTTKENIIIGSLYIMLLEKTGVDWSGVSSAKLQHFGIPARLTNRDKNSSPGRNQPVRLLGEDEVRLFSATVGPDTTAELLEMSNNPVTHKHIVTNILHAEHPTNIENIVDRTVVPRGNSRPLVFIRHMLQCGGMEFVYKPAMDMPASIYTGPNTKADEPIVEVFSDDDD